MGSRDRDHAHFLEIYVRGHVGLSLAIHSLIYFNNSGNKAHKTTDKRSDIKTYTNIKTQKDRQRMHRENCTDYRGVCE